jgi:hypothetical protein
MRSRAIAWRSPSWSGAAVIYGTRVIGAGGEIKNLREKQTLDSIGNSTQVGA